MLMRIFSAAILIPLVLLGIFKANNDIFRYASFGLILVASFEWANLAQINSKKGILFFVFTVFLITFFTMPADHEIFGFLLYLPFFIAGALLWVRFFYLTLKQRAISKKEKILSGIIFLPAACFALYVFTFLESKEWLLYLLIIVWAADSGAYFAGKLLGKRKFFEKVSPNKTLEGAIGGVVIANLVCIGLLFTPLYSNVVDWSNFTVVILEDTKVPQWYALLMLNILIVTSILGDLAESWLKRLANIKDSGKIIPGHGGILDRIDSLLPVLCVSQLLCVLTIYVWG